MQERLVKVLFALILFFLTLIRKIRFSAMIAFDFGSHPLVEPQLN